MDSSCEGKFSRHLVIRAPQAAFANNAVVGAAVNDILSMPQVTLTFAGPVSKSIGDLCKPSAVTTSAGRIEQVQRRLEFAARVLATQGAAS